MDDIRLESSANVWPPCILSFENGPNEKEREGRRDGDFLERVEWNPRISEEEDD